MWYVFRDNKCISTSSAEPCPNDLDNQGVVAAESNEGIPFTEAVLVDGVVTRYRTPEQSKAIMVALRDKLMNDTAWLFQRQMTGTDSQKMPEEDYAAVVTWWAALRNYPANYIEGLPLPTAPSCIASIVSNILGEGRA